MQLLFRTGTYQYKLLLPNVIITTLVNTISMFFLFIHGRGAEPTARGPNAAHVNI